MAARKTKKDLAAMSPEEREAYEKRLAQQRAPRDAYLVYGMNEDGTIAIHSATRDPNEVLKATAGQTELKYAAFQIK